MISYNYIYMTITLREGKQMLPDIAGKALQIWSVKLFYFQK